MRTSILIALAVLITISFWQCARIPGSRTLSGDILAPLRDSVHFKSPNPGFRKDQLVVFPNQPSNPENINAIKAAMKAAGIDTSLIRIRACSSCPGDVQLWEAPNIATYVVTEGVRSGSGPGSGGVGEDSHGRYSLNFTNRIPTDTIPPSLINYNASLRPVNNLAGKKVVRIAVLDTGVDSVRLIHNSYLWNNEDEKANGQDDDRNCYTDDVAGWNFINNTPDFRDDNNHGSLVTKFIIDQFSSSRTTGVQIMPLKTHDSRGYGDMFASICALKYAMDNGVNIINASWGFYNYGENPVPYLDSLITQALPRLGILFVTAAGNRTADNDIEARRIYREMHPGASPLSDAGLRNLQINPFYPAVLSRVSNNVIVATTTNGSFVSTTQNSSSMYVDLGVMADHVDPRTRAMSYNNPFDGVSVPVAGSSYATAIVTGKIGVNFKQTLYTPGITKQQVFNDINSVISRSSELAVRQLIREGRYIRR